MKISTRGKYGLLAMLHLAVQSDSEPVKLSAVADRYGISASYLEQILSSLRKSGLIRSSKGAQGGYILAKEASEITAGDILRVLEGDLFEVPFDDLGSDSITYSLERCLKTEVWDKIDESIRAVVDNTTLADLVKIYGYTIEVLSFMPNL